MLHSAKCKPALVRRFPLPDEEFFMAPLPALDTWRSASGSGAGAPGGSDDSGSDWFIRPEDVIICKDPRGNDWQLGSGAYGSVRLREAKHYTWPHASTMPGARGHKKSRSYPIVGLQFLLLAFPVRARTSLSMSMRYAFHQVERGIRCAKPGNAPSLAGRQRDLHVRRQWCDPCMAHRLLIQRQRRTSSWAYTEVACLIHWQAYEAAAFLHTLPQHVLPVQVYKGVHWMLA